MKKKRLSIYVTMLGLAMATAPVFTSCEDMLEEKVNLQLWVKVKKDWRDSDMLLKNYGYDKKEV